MPAVPAVAEEGRLKDAAVAARQVQHVLRGVRGDRVQRRRQAQQPQQRACLCSGAMKMRLAQHWRWAIVRSRASVYVRVKSTRWVALAINIPPSLTAD